MKRHLIHESGLTKEVKKGFSWTTFFFGCLVPLIRGDLKWAAIMFLISIILGMFTMGIGSFVVGIVFAFKYNEIYYNDLLLKGFKPAEVKTSTQQVETLEEF